MKVAIIGGGPSGIVTLKYLLAAPQFLGSENVEVQLFEYKSCIGGAFAHRVYEGAELVSSKQLTTFSDFRHPSPKDFLSPQEYVAYLESYCTHFGLWPHINLKTRVLSVRRRARGHVVRYAPADGSGEEVEWTCDAVAVCSGLHVEPNLAHVEGLEKVPIVIHSSEFKTRSQFGVGKTVMVLGSGETGADVAQLAITSPTERVVMCHKKGFHLAPKINPGPIILPILGRKPNPNEKGIPLDVSRANMFDTTYVHPILRNGMLLWQYYDAYVKSFIWIAGGSRGGVHQWVGELSREDHHVAKIFFNKSGTLAPYISRPYHPETTGKGKWIYRLRAAFVQTPEFPNNGRTVDLAPWPQRFDEQGVVEFQNNGRPEYERMKDEKVRPDVVVLCTGYKQSFPFFSTQQNEQPYPKPREANVRGIWKRDDPTVGFVGFFRPALGAIPPLAEMQAQLWVTRLLAPKQIATSLSPEDESHYRVLHEPGNRIQYGVDHESYAFQLALDLDSAPGLPSILQLMSRLSLTKAWRLLIIWIFGANLNTKYRLQGPWMWDGALETFISDEFWETITRRPYLFGHFCVNILPMLIFGPISLFYWSYATTLSVLASLGTWAKPARNPEPAMATPSSPLKEYY